MGTLVIKKNFTVVLGIKAGDTEYIRLILEDANGDVIDLTSTYTGVLGIKRNIGDSLFVIPEIPIVFHSISKGYTLEVKIPSSDTLELLNYDGKERENVKLYFDLEVTDTTNAVVTTVLQGTFNVSRSIGGVF